MIINLNKFILAETPFWDELETEISRLEQTPKATLGIDRAKRLYYLYERASASLARLQTFSVDQTTTNRLERLVARSYTVIHSTGNRRVRMNIFHWFFNSLPQAFRTNINALILSVLITLAGSLFGALCLYTDYDSKSIIMPFAHLHGSPSERVEQEERDVMSGSKSAFASHLMVHNIQVSILTMALGLTFGIGTIILLFYNGVILGAVIFDYLQAGEGTFLTGWLLPHGSVEIPAIIIAGQAGLIIASTFFGWGNRLTIKERFHKASPDIITLMLGVAILLVWAGIIEAFFSQYHEPTVPYWAKILFGFIQLILLIIFFSLSGRKGKTAK